MVTNVSQRKIPLLVQIILFASLIYKSFTLESIPELFYFFLGSLISSGIALIMAFFHRKVSLHMLGISSLTFFSMFASIHFGIKGIYFIAFLFFANGLVASSRLTMKAHTPLELALGYLIGLIPQLLLLFYWL